jgi:hypothetical protein
MFIITTGLLYKVQSKIMRLVIQKFVMKVKKWSATIFYIINHLK